MDPFVQKIAKELESGKSHHIEIGDKVRVMTEIVEGEKKRVQAYEGTVVQIRGIGISKTFTVHRVSYGYPNEKIFPFHSPAVVRVETLQKGKTRRSKLNHIRGMTGKKSKIAAQENADLNPETIET